jgi:hypothetical protein
VLSTLNDLESRVLKVEEDNLELVVPAIENPNGLVDSLQVAVGRVMVDVDQALDEVASKVNDMSRIAISVIKSSMIKSQKETSQNRNFFHP